MDDAKNEVKIGVELTPNPNTLKFLVNQILLESGSVDFPSPEKAAGSPLPQKLFETGEVQSVFIGTDFISISKKSEVRWEPLVEKVFPIMKSVLESGEPWIAPELLPRAENRATNEVERMIQEVLDTEIRPAVARDGGDIIFDSF